MAVLDWFSKKKKTSSDATGPERSRGAGSPEVTRGAEPRGKRGDLARKPKVPSKAEGLEVPSKAEGPKVEDPEVRQPADRGTKASSAPSELRTAREEKLLIGEVKGRAHKILQRPHITEKSTMLNLLGKYIFSVFPGANANEIRKAVQEVYKVHVVDVNIINLPAKRRRRGRHIYTATRNPKAVVTLKAGETIDISV